MFNICFRSAPFTRDGEDLLLGTIEGPGLKEDFWAPLSHWQKDRYESQWREGVRTVLEGQPSALVVSMRNPQFANFVNWWLLYPMDEQIVLQNQMLVLDGLSLPFNEQKIYSFIRPYQSHNEEGEALSEWKMSRASFVDFAKQ